jgi:uncharacterized membrane protein YjgN (DUF898 family)
MKKGKVLFTGHFVEYFFKSLFFIILSVITLGIMFPYYLYWSVKYFVDNLEIEIDE